MRAKPLTICRWRAPSSKRRCLGLGAFHSYQIQFKVCMKSKTCWKILIESSEIKREREMRLTEKREGEARPRGRKRLGEKIGRRRARTPARAILCVWLRLCNGWSCFIWRIDSTTMETITSRTQRRSSKGANFSVWLCLHPELTFDPKFWWEYWREDLGRAIQISGYEDRGVDTCN